ncbi:MAG TPA: hypothetical protein VMI93_12135 [Candidatus Solibacter sp.]|nr:hypothetical protein [Candidatus Solibacter sp.]
MKHRLALALLTLALTSYAQTPLAPSPVALKSEPHHHLVLENAYVRAWFFDVAGHESTLLHAHDLPYVGIALMPGDYTNAVAGKPDAHAVLDDGQLNYSKGGFAHVVRTDAGSPFKNFTIELLRPQGTPRNRCLRVIDADLNCPVEAAGNPVVETPAFETDEVLIQAGGLSQGRFYNAPSSQSPRLFVVLSDSELTVELRGAKAKPLHGGELYWLPAGESAVFTDARKEKKKSKDADSRAQEELKISRYFILAFKD